MTQSAGIVVHDVIVTGRNGTQHCAMHPISTVRSTPGWVNGSGNDAFKSDYGICASDQREDICSGYSHTTGATENPGCSRPSVRRG